MRPVVIAVMLAIVLASCQTTGGRGGSFCDTARPQRPSAAEIEAMSPERRREVLAHNEYGATACGWRP